MAVRKKRAEGTPCNKENFESWKARFDAEMAQKENEQDDNEDGKPGQKRIKKQGSSTVDRSDRITGFDYFRSQKVNMDALERAAEEAERQEMDDDEEEEIEKPLDIDEDLFADDVDLDDLDFDSDDDEEEVDI